MTKKGHRIGTILVDKHGNFKKGQLGKSLIDSDRCSEIGLRGIWYRRKCIIGFGCLDNPGHNLHIMSPLKPPVLSDQRQ